MWILIVIRRIKFIKKGKAVIFNASYYAKNYYNKNRVIYMLIFGLQIFDLC